MHLNRVLSDYEMRNKTLRMLKNHDVWAMIADMFEKIDKEKYSLDKVALLALFAVSLLIGQIIVSHRSKVHLSGPIELGFAGVSAVLPQDGGWEGLDSWVFDEKENGFLLVSGLTVRTGTEAVVQWRYLLAAKTAGTDGHLAERIADENVEVVDIGQEQLNEVTFEWAQVKKPGSASGSFWGVAQLEHGRAIWLDVAAGDLSLAEDVFKKVIRSISVQDDGLHGKGARFVQSAKSELKRQRIGNRNSGYREHIYLLGPKGGKASGFVLETFNLSDLETGGGFEGKVFYHRRSALGWISDHNLFRISSDLDTFHWENVSVTSRQQRGNLTLLELSEDGLLKVVRSNGMVRQFRFGDALVADPMIDTFLTEFLDSSEDKVLIDLVIKNGTIIPTIISRTDPGLVQISGVNVAYSLRMDFFHSKGMYQEVYFDSDKRIVGKHEHGRDDLLWYRVDRETLSSIFANWREYTGGLF